MLETERLILRAPLERDYEPFAALNADPRVMEYFRAALSREESDAMLDRIAQAIHARGFSLWIAERKSDKRTIGFIGLSVPGFPAPFSCCASHEHAAACWNAGCANRVVEAGWRLAHEFWGQGYAPEGARAALDFAFAKLPVSEVVSFTSVGNLKSRRVMEKVGMTHDPARDFEHPLIPEGHPLRRHVLYRAAKALKLS